MFDCDGTLIKGDIGEAMFYHQIEHFLLRVSPAQVWTDHPRLEELSNLYESLSDLPPEKAVHDRRFVSLADMMLGWYFDQLSEGKTEKACSDIVRLFAGYSRAEAQDIARVTLRKEIGLPAGSRSLGTLPLPQGIRYIKESVDLLFLLRQRGFDIWVVSGSSQWSVEAVSHRLGVRPDHVIGIDLRENRGFMTGAAKQPVPVLGGKVAALKSRGTTRPLLVVSDSTYDIPLFEYSAGSRILIRSNGEVDFFAAGKMNRDQSWVVIDPPTYLDQNTWPTHP